MSLWRGFLVSLVLLVGCSQRTCVVGFQRQLVQARGRVYVRSLYTCEEGGRQYGNKSKGGQGRRVRYPNR